MKILLADDEPDIQLLVSMALEDSGHEIVTANDGREALEKVRAGPFDLIILDAMMPVMGGIEAFGQLAASPSTARIPVIFMTARPEDAALSDALVRGARGYIRKPFDVDTLCSDIEACLKS